MDIDNGDNRLRTLTKRKDVLEKYERACIRDINEQIDKACLAHDNSVNIYYGDSYPELTRRLRESYTITFETDNYMTISWRKDDTINS